MVAPGPADYEIVFDGGSLNNPGRGYGSFRLRGPAVGSRIERREFGQGVTNNEAEYRALIEALEALLAALERAGGDPAATSVLALGDSQLVISQVAGRWKVGSPNLVPLNRRARDLVGRFGRVELRWHPRARSVATLGH